MRNKQTVKIIDGKRYNKETATLVASWDNGLGPTDFRNCDEELYRTPGGSWFVVGEGGALSPYAQPCGNNGHCGGSAWVALTDEQAFEWLESHNETSALETYFSDKIPDA